MRTHPEAVLTKGASEARSPARADEDLIFLRICLGISVALALWLTRGAWGPEQQAGWDTSGHLVRAQFGIELLKQGRIDGWFPRFMSGHQGYLFYGPGFAWVLGLLQLLSLGMLSVAGAMKVAVILSFVAFGPATAFLARALGFTRRQAGPAAILALAVNNHYGVGLNGAYDSGLIPHQIAAPIFAVALGAILMAVKDSRPRWVLIGSMGAAMLALTHPISLVAMALCGFLVLCSLPLGHERLLTVGSLMAGLALVSMDQRYLAPVAVAAPVGLYLLYRRQPGAGPTIRRLALCGAFAVGLIAFWAIPRAVHSDLGSGIATWGIPPLGIRLGQILRGEELFAFPIGWLIAATWVIALLALVRRRSHLFATVVVPIGFLVIAHSLARPPMSPIGQLLANRGLGYAGLFAVIGLAGVLAARASRPAGLAIAVLASIGLVLWLPGSPRHTARQEDQISADERAAARQLASLVHEPARFATQANPDVVPFRYLASASGRNELNVFNGDSSPAAWIGYLPFDIGRTPPVELAGKMARAGVSHVVTIGGTTTAELSASGRFQQVWKSGELAILAVEPDEGQPPPDTLISAGAPLDARLIHAEPGREVLEVSSAQPVTATLAYSWSPKWRLFIDGKANPLKPTGDKLLAARLPAGTSRVELAFTSDGWDRLGGATSLATLALLVLWAVRQRGRLPQPQAVLVVPTAPPAPATLPARIDLADLSLSRISVVLAGPQSRSAIERVLASAQNFLEYEVIVAGEPDDSFEGHERVRRLSVPAEAGIGSAIRLGIEASRYELVLLAQGPVDRLSDFLPQTGGADVVLGTLRTAAPVRGALLEVGDFFAGLLFWTPPGGIRSPYLLIRRSALDGIQTASKGGLVRLELIVKLARSGATFRRVDLDPPPPETPRVAPRLGTAALDLRRLVRRAGWFGGKAVELEEVPSRRGPLIALAALMVIYVVAFSTWTIRNHDGFGTFGFDLGIFDQGTWLLSRFQRPFITIRGLHLFGDHTSFILMFLAPLYWLIPSAKVLLVTQSTAIGAAAMPLYLIGREKLKSGWMAVAVAAAFLIQPALSWTNFEQFHPDAFEVPLLLTAIYLAMKHRWRWFIVSLLLLLLIKEDVPLATFMLGFWVARHHSRKVGLATMVLSAIWWLANLFVILPHFNGVGSLYTNRLPFGGFGGLIKTTLTDPIEVIKLMLGPDKPQYIWQLLAPVALIALLAPAVLLIAAGPLVANLLNGWWYGYHIQYHYSTLILPVLGAATVFGIARIRSQPARRSAIGLLLGSAVLTAYAWGPIPMAKHAYPIGDPSREYAASVRKALAMIPDDAGVSAFYSYVPHLTHRARIYEFGNPWRASNWADGSNEGKELPEAKDVDYIIVPTDLSQDTEAVLDRLRPEFDTLFADRHVRLFKRKSVK